MTNIKSHDQHHVTMPRLIVAGHVIITCQRERSIMRMNLPRGSGGQNSLHNRTENRIVNAASKHATVKSHSQSPQP